MKAASVHPIGGPTRPLGRAARPCTGPWLRAWLALLCGILFAGWSPSVWAVDCGQSPLQAVAPGVWAWPGADQDLAASNGGAIVTNVVVMDEAQAHVIDPGSTQAHGQALYAATQCLGRVHINAVWNSHAHAENTLGNSAFTDHGVEVWATAETQAAMRQRCPACLRHVLETLTPQLGAGTRIVIPQRVWPPALTWQTLRVGQHDWALRAFSHAHSESDLVWWDAQHRTLIAAGLVYQRRLPELAQGQLRQWLRTLDELLALAPRVVIGQQVGDVSDLAATRAYLCSLQNGVLDALERGDTASQTPMIALPAFSGWAAYGERQAFNTQRAWRELEGLWMDGKLSRCKTGSDPN